ncbi:MAG: endonuclease/exonuclease/phosphatase family protein [Candidatus Thermoplasmatota archaeon]|nr:endonuclease/exonuclease/phosphatase family protein [Candidatus Thermoplasmatota archaeon]
MSKRDRRPSTRRSFSRSKVGTYHMVLWTVSFTLGMVFLLQSLKEFFASVYFYNLISLAVSPVVGLLLIFSLPLITGPIVKRIGFRNTYLLSGAVMVASRLPMGMGLARPGHLIFSTAALGSSMLFMTIVLALHRRERETDPEVFSSQSAVASFGLAYLLIMVFTALGHGVDASIVPSSTGIMLSPAISTILCGAMGISLYLQRGSIILNKDRKGEKEAGTLFTGGIADSWAPAWGIGGSIFVFLAVISNPSITSGWLGSEFQMSLSMSMAALGLFLLSLLSSSGMLLSMRRTFSNPKGAVLGNIVLLLAAANMFFFGYPLPMAPLVIVWIGMVDTWIILDAATDSKPFAGESLRIDSSKGSKIIGFPHKSRNRSYPGHFGKAMALAMGSFAFLILLLTVALNWSFVPLGSLLEGSIPSLMFAGFVILALSGFSCSKFKMDEPSVNPEQSSPHLNKGSPTMAAGKGSGMAWGQARTSPRLRAQWLTVGAVTICLIILTGTVSVINYSDGPVEKKMEKGDELKVATYNIHHGYSNDGRIDPVLHLELIRDLDPDILFLQESDSLLFSEGNFDPAFYLSSRLDMYLFRGPDPGTGSPGVAILTRFPMKDLKVHYLPSTAIQRIALSCMVTIADEDVRLIGLHMGLEEKEREDQMIDLRDIIEGFDEEVIVGGDLNTEPHEKMMSLLNPDLFGNGNTTSNTTYLNLGSVWHSSTRMQRDSRPMDTPTYPSPDVDDEQAHIDYILFSDGFEVVKAGIEDGEGISDHRMVWGALTVTFS